MSIFKRRDTAEIQIIFDNDRFEEIAALIRGLVNDVDEAVERLETAKKDMIKASVRLEAAKRTRPTIRNSG